MKKSKKVKALAFSAILLVPFLCSFTEGEGESQEYLFRRNYEKILVERFTNSEISIAPGMSTLHTSNGNLSSFYENEELAHVSGALNGFSSPISVNYHYASDGSLDRYSNGHILLEKFNEGFTTDYVIDGDRVLTVFDKPEYTTLTYQDGEEVSEFRFADGGFEITRNNYWAYRGIDGSDGMLSCESYDGLQECWTYDEKGDLASYLSSDSTYYEKTATSTSSTSVSVRVRGLLDDYSVLENGCAVSYSCPHGTLISNYDIDSSIKSYGFGQSGTNWQMQFGTRGDKPLEQIGIASSPYGTYRFTFGDNNLITSTTRDGVTQKTYQYDGMNRLVSSADNVGTSYYVYDDANNITKAICRSDDVIGDWFYTYSGSRLVSVNDAPVSFDVKGNVVSYGRENYQWNMGSLLSKYISDDSVISFQYDAMNNPIVKTLNSTDQKRLVWEGKRLVAESNGSKLLSFFYDCFGSPIGFSYNGSLYAYCKNAFQDVVGIIRDDGALIAEYSYGDFGEPGRTYDIDGSGIAYLNPFRYRSYYFDQDLGLYHLKSRWYSPELRRFLSSDSPRVLLDQAFKSELLLNRYSYCANNPINYTDSQGTFADALAIGAAAAGSIVCPWLAPLLIIAGAVLIGIAGAAIVNGEASGQVGGVSTETLLSIALGGDGVYVGDNGAVSVVESLPTYEPIIGGEAGVAISAAPEVPVNPFSDADVQRGLRLLKEALGLALASALTRVLRQYRHPKEWHHIVPRNKNDFFGWMPYVRAYMYDYAFPQIGVDSMNNQVHISTLLHKGLHNVLFLEAVATALYPTTFVINPEPFRAVLAFIKGQIMVIDASLPL